MKDEAAPGTLDRFGSTRAERAVYIAGQLLALALMIASWWVPRPFAITACTSAAAALVGLAVPSDAGRRRWTQLLAALIALLTSGMLLAEGYERRQAVPVVESAILPELHMPRSQVATRRQDPRDATVAPPATRSAAIETPVAPGPGQYAAPTSTGAAGEHELASDLDGIPLPDFGEGTPFANVAMTNTEMEAFVQLYVEYMQTQKELQAQFERGQITYDDLVTAMTERAEELMDELEAVLGADRVAILTQELERYHAQLALDPDRLNQIDGDAMRRSRVYRATVPE